ncbi:MAG TPA: type II secretion system F family protein [Blastocatellia bacterium]|nr:type II secretion system F family protein [Blastocatellia bacterium]
MLIVLTAMIFLVTMSLTISAIYFFIEAPAAKKKMRARLAAIEQSSIESSVDAEMAVLREQMLSEVPALNRLLLRVPLATKLDLFIQQSASNMTVAMLLLISFSLAFFVFLIGLMTFLPIYLVLAIAVGCGAIPFGVIAFKRQRRFSKFEEMFPDAIDTLARAVRAGHAFTTGLDVISREMPEPIATEFRITYEQQNFGMPLREALHNLTVRMPLTDVRFFVSALQIQRESGGNLGEILDNLSQVIRERFKILRQVKVHTAQGRMTLYFLMAMPPLFGVLMYLRNPKYVGRLFTDPLGQKALIFGAVLQIIGCLIIRKIIRIKV